MYRGENHQFLELGRARVVRAYLVRMRANLKTLLDDQAQVAKARPRLEYTSRFGDLCGMLELAPRALLSKVIPQVGACLHLVCLLVEIGLLPPS